MSPRPRPKPCPRCVELQAFDGRRKCDACKVGRYVRRVHDLPAPPELQRPCYAVPPILVTSGDAKHQEAAA